MFYIFQVCFATERGHRFTIGGKFLFYSTLVGVEMKYSSIKINKPFYIGMSILDLSKVAHV